MGVCESMNSKSKNLINFIPQGCEYSDIYRFECQSKNILTKKTYNLEFVFSEIKIKHCISHSPSKNSIYIVQVSIGILKFNLIINKNKTPIIDPKNIFKISKEFSLEELQNTLLSIYAYEFIDGSNINVNVLTQMNELPEEYISQSNYKSFFHMDLFSFLFKAKKCDFLMKGINGLSSNTRICFTCDINHKEKIKIHAKDTIYIDYSYKLIFKLDNFNSFSNLKSRLFGDFNLTTPLISMKEFKKGDLFRESKENKPTYRYITLNDLKNEIIKKLGKDIIKKENNYITNYKGINQDKTNENYSNNSYQSNSTLQTTVVMEPTYISPNLNIKDSNKFSSSKKEILLNLENLPLITQTSCLYFTELGHLYNTALLHIINNDQELQVYRNNSKISSDYFYMNLKKIYDDLNSNKENFDFKSLFDELNILLRRSIDTEKFYFLYSDIESLNKMIILMMNLGIKLIEYVKITKEEEKIMNLLKSINNLLKREELDNSVINMCLSKTIEEQENTLKNVYNNFYLKLFKLNEYCIQKKIPDLNPILIDIYTKLYFRKRYIREAIFNAVNNDNKPYTNDQIDVFIYDIINDEKLNRYLDQSAFNQVLQNKYLFKNFFSCGTLFFKSIILYLNSLKINEFPFDFTQFNDNMKILDLLGKYIKNKKIDNLENQFYEIPALLYDSYDSINAINNGIIMNTHGYVEQAIFKLFDYMKSLLEYYYTKEQNRLIMDYTLLEKAVTIILNIDNSITIPKVFWFYYSCSHLILSGDLKCFIINICNKNFNTLAYHWSFGVRQIFFKLILFIFNDKLKNEEGKLLNVENIDKFDNNNLDEKNIYNIEAMKDYKLVNKEYKEWLNNYKSSSISNNNDIFNTQKEYPVFFVPLPVNPDKID